MPEAGGGAVRVDLPARLNLLGNPSDANEGDYAVISLAVELRAEVIVRAATGRRARVDGAWIPLPAELPAPAEGPARLVVAALDALVEKSVEARAALAGRGFEVELATAIPRGSGMGGSSVLGLGCLVAFARWLDLDARAHHLYRLAEWAQLGEERFAGVVGGYIDFYAPLFGGLSYVDFRGKLLHGPEGEAPFATLERLDALVPPLPLVVAWSGLEHASGDVHAPMRARYLAESARGSGELLGIMRAVGDCAWLGKQALLRGDLAEVGRLLDRNHALVDRMMRTCGFADGAGAANNALIEAARAAGALARSSRAPGAAARSSPWPRRAASRRSKRGSGLRCLGSDSRMRRSSIPNRQPRAFASAGGESPPRPCR